MSIRLLLAIFHPELLGKNKKMGNKTSSSQQVPLHFLFSSYEYLLLFKKKKKSILLGKRRPSTPSSHKKIFFISGYLAFVETTLPSGVSFFFLLKRWLKKLFKNIIIDWGIFFWGGGEDMRSWEIQSSQLLVCDVDFEIETMMQLCALLFDSFRTSAVTIHRATWRMCWFLVFRVLFFSIPKRALTLFFLRSTSKIPAERDACVRATHVYLSYTRKWIKNVTNSSTFFFYPPHKK